MIILYGRNQSRSSRALWALEEAELEYDYQQIRLGRTGLNGARSEFYMKLNPQGKAPTLVDGDLVVTESAAILNYIASLVPDKQLIPLNDIKLRARYDQLCFFVLSELEQPLWTSAKHRFALPKKLRLANIDTTTHWEFAKAITALNSLLDDQKFAVNQHFTMADILICQTLTWADNNGFNVPDNLLSYSHAIYKRPAYLRALKAQQNDE